MCVGYLRLVFWLSMATREPFGLGLYEKKNRGREGKNSEKGKNGEKRMKTIGNDRDEDWSIGQD